MKVATTLIFRIANFEKRFSLLTDVEPVLTIEEYLQLSEEEINDRVSRLENSIPVCSGYNRVNDIFEKEEEMFVRGMIMPFYGDTAPEGWVICDGANNTPDLRGKVLVGQDFNDSDFNQIGITGGAKKITLTESQTPPHRHHALLQIDSASNDGVQPFTTAGSTSGMGADTWSYSIRKSHVEGEANAALTSNPLMSSVNDVVIQESVDIMMPYAVINYIMKL